MLSMSSSYKKRINRIASTLACIGLLIPSQIPAKSSENTTDNSNHPAIATSTPILQQNLEADSDQLVRKLEQLQTNVLENSIAISLEDAIALGVKNNPDLEIAFREIQEREWQLIRAKRKWYPTLNINGGSPFTGYSWSTFVSNNYAKRAAIRDIKGGTTSQTTETSAAQTIKRPTTPRTTKARSKDYLTNASATISWNFLDLTRQPDINSAEDNLRRQKLLFNVSARNLILAIQQSYFSIQSSAQLIDSFNQIYAINKQQFRILSERQKIGMATVLDVEQTKSQLFAQLNQLVSYTQQYITQAGQLAKNLALKPGELAIPIEKAKPQGFWTRSLRQTIDEALQQREEILAEIAAAEAADWTGIASLRQYLPVFSIQASGNLLNRNGYQNIPANEDPTKNRREIQKWDATIGIGFRWNAFDGGLNAANAETQFAQSRRFLATASKSKLQIAQEVQSSYGAMETAKIGIKSAEQAYRSAEIAQEAARARFDVGVGDIFSVVQAINLLSNAARQTSEATLTYNNSIAELYRYSANWPMESQKDVDLRIKTNNQTTKP